jgi:hypothetical protein
VIREILIWALSKFTPEKEEIKEWPFPAVSKDFDPRPKKKVVVKKATTRPAKKKPAVVAKTVAAKKTAKKKAK